MLIEEKTFDSSTEEGNVKSILVSKDASADDRVPRPRRASEALPDVDALAAHGIPLTDVEQARLVLCLLSRFLGRGRAASRSQLRAMMAALTSCCTIAVEYDGEAETPPHPELSGIAWPHAPTVFKHLSIDSRVLDEYWLASRNRATDACFPVEWVIEFFPPQIWPAVATLIGWGPERTRIRMEEAVKVLARTRTTRETRRRPKGSLLSFGTIDAWLTALQGLLAELVNLRDAALASRQAALPVDQLKAWTTAPRRPNLRDCGVRPSGQDNSAPPLAEVQERLHEFAGEYEAHPGSYHRLRRLVLLSLLAVLGPRATALRTLDVSDFVADAPGPDGIRRDALDLRPGKTWEADEVHRVPLPAQVAAWVREWIQITGRGVGQRGTPLFPHKKPKPGLELTHLSEVGFYSAIAGRPRSDGSSGSRALLPLNGDPYVGYRPHALRHLCEQLAQRAAVELKQERPGELDHYTPEDFARALLGHSLVRSVSDVYRDVDRNKLTYLVVDKAWDILFGDGGVRTGLDPEAIRTTRTKLEATQALLRTREAKQGRLSLEQERLAQHAFSLSGDELLHASIQSNALLAQLAAIERELAGIREQLAYDKEAHRLARTRRVPLANDLNDEDYARLVEEALAETGHASTELDAVILSVGLTVSDLAELFGTTEQTVNRWYRQGPPRHRPAPWRAAADSWILNSKKDKRLLVDALDPAALSDSQREKLLELRRRRAILDGEGGAGAA